MRMGKWWRPARTENPSIEMLLARVAQLEREVQKARGRNLFTLVEPYTFEMDLSKVPLHVQENLEKARLNDIHMKASGVGWRDVLTPRRVLAADGTQILNTTTETIMVPDFTFQADYFEVGDAVKYMVMGDFSGQAAANTHTARLRWGGVAGTPVLAASGAFAFDPTAASTTVSEMFEWWVVCRSVGTAGSFFCMGRAGWNDFDDASATTLKNNLDMNLMPASAPAAATSADTTVSKAMSPTMAFSSATATVQWTSHIALLESLN